MLYCIYHFISALSIPSFAPGKPQAMSMFFFLKEMANAPRRGKSQLVKCHGTVKREVDNLIS